MFNQTQALTEIESRTAGLQGEALKQELTRIVNETSRESELSELCCGCEK